MGPGGDTNKHAQAFSERQLCVQRPAAVHVCVTHMLHDLHLDVGRKRPYESDRVLRRSAQRRIC